MAQLQVMLDIHDNIEYTCTALIFPKSLAWVFVYPFFTFGFNTHHSSMATMHKPV